MPNKLSSKLGGTFGKLLTNVEWQSSGEVVLTKGVQAYKTSKQTQKGVVHLLHRTHNSPGLASRTPA